VEKGIGPVERFLARMPYVGAWIVNTAIVLKMHPSYFIKTGCHCYDTFGVLQ
jgi:hypothetical protein